MGATTGFNAGIDSSDVTVSFIKEVAWNIVPTTPTFQLVRLTGEGLSETKTRARPGEIRATGDAAHAVTTQVESSGNLNFAFSFGTYDEFLEGLVNGTLAADLAIVSIATTGIITMFDGTTTPLPTLGGPGFSTNHATLLDTITPGQWVRISGYGTLSDGLYRCDAVDTTNDEVSVAVGAGNEPNIVDADASTGSEVNIQGAMLRNGVDFFSFQIEKQLAAALFLNYGGAYISGGNLSAQVGGFMEGAFNFLMAQEAKGTATLSTGGAPPAAPAGRVIDTVAGFSKLEVADTAIAAVAQGIDINLTKEGARAQFGLGSAAAQGMGRGTITAAGTLSVYFIDFTLYDLYKNETDSIVSFAALDDLGEGYIITLPAATLMNPTVVAGGPDTDVVSEFELEANPASSGEYFTGLTIPVTIQIDKIPAAI